jgi:hypothetical protein
MSVFLCNDFTYVKDEFVERKYVYRFWCNLRSDNHEELQ